jgi:hypothetical protein
MISVWREGERLGRSGAGIVRCGVRSRQVYKNLHAFTFGLYISTFVFDDSSEVGGDGVC